MKSKVTPKFITQEKDSIANDPDANLRSFHKANLARTQKELEDLIAESGLREEIQNLEELLAQSCAHPLDKLKYFRNYFSADGYWETQAHAVHSIWCTDCGSVFLIGLWAYNLTCGFTIKGGGLLGTLVSTSRSVLCMPPFDGQGT